MKKKKSHLCEQWSYRVANSLEWNFIGPLSKKIKIFLNLNRFARFIGLTNNLDKMNLSTGEVFQRIFKRIVIYNNQIFFISKNKKMHEQNLQK